LQILPRGIVAALPTPCRDDGAPSVELIDPLVDFLAQTSLKGLCIGGATAEYLAYSPGERTEMLRHLLTRVQGRLPVIFGVGGESYRQVIWLIEAAPEAGATTLLLPAPAYFRYGADDLVEITTRAASMSSLPVLMYLIPQFSGDLGIQNALGLVKSVPNIAGIKDSSGLQSNLNSMAQAKQQFQFSFFCGSDDLLLDALIHGADGAISGVASACPELILAIYQAHELGRIDEARRLQRLLDEFIAAIGDFPVPWGIRWAIEARGFSIGSAIWPLNARRQSQALAFRHWFTSWWPACKEHCSQTVSAK
jgi:4-hydroxy-tetrahydrodipicolinate synthase